MTTVMPEQQLQTLLQALRATPLCKLQRPAEVNHLQQGGAALILEPAIRIAAHRQAGPPR